MSHKILSKAEAWASVPKEEERFTPVDKTAHQFQFTRNWFHNRNCCTFSTFFPREFDGTKPVRLIQIGVFEAMDLVWQLQNTLRHPNSRVFAVDPWVATTKLDQEYMEGVHDRAIWNLRPYREKVVVHRGYSQQALRDGLRAKRLAGVPTGHWDIVIIDGDHNAPAVLEDAELALQLVRVGGWLVFDDVRNQQPKKDHVEAGLRKFLDIHEHEVEPVWSHRYCECFRKVNPPAVEPAE